MPTEILFLVEDYHYFFFGFAFFFIIGGFFAEDAFCDVFCLFIVFTFICVFDLLGSPIMVQHMTDKIQFNDNTLNEDDQLKLLD